MNPKMKRYVEINRLLQIPGFAETILGTLLQKEKKILEIILKK